MSVFVERNHLFLRNPRGGVEDVAAMVAAGFELILCNVGDHAASEWDTVRDRCATAGAIVAPWLRTSAPGNVFSPELLESLIDVADDWRSPLCVNAESELKGTGGEATTLIAEMVGDRDAAISMEPWPFDKVDWYRLSDYPVMPQQSTDYASYTPDELRSIWRAYGIPCVVITCGAFGGSKASDYERRSPFGVYTADDMGQQYAAWSPLGTVEPCAGVTPPPDPEPIPPNGGDVADNAIPTPKPNEVIGSNHGITALVDWLQQQPGMPTRGSDYDATKPKTWPWPERVERTLRILSADHDASLPKSSEAEA